jgi:cytochrome P450
MPQDARNIDAESIPLSEIDVSNPQLYADDTWGPLFARLRREAPVHYCCQSAYGPYWSVTRYDDIMAVELDHATFSSAGGIHIAHQLPGAQYGNFIRMDPPRHTAQRKTVAPIATPTHVAKLEGLIRERTDKVLDGLPRNETFDWVDKVSIELTTMMLATLLGFPWEDRRLLTYWSDVAIANLGAPDSPVKTEEERFAELTRMGQFFAELFEERARKPPSNDLISMMVHSEAMRSQPQHEFIGNLSLLIVVSEPSIGGVSKRPGSVEPVASPASAPCVAKCRTR